MKRDTRELILAHSLALFNELGEPGVTTNHIADAADISPGNLYYHFRSKADIVTALFRRFALQMNPLMEAPLSARVEAEDLWFQWHRSFELKSEYRFLYRNLTDLARRMPVLYRAFRGLCLRERQSAAHMIDALEADGVVVIDAAEKPLLLNNLMLAFVYWIPFAELLAPAAGRQERIQLEAIAGAMQMLLPYLRAAEHDYFSALAAAYLKG